MNYITRKATLEDLPTLLKFEQGVSNQNAQWIQP